MARELPAGHRRHDRPVGERGRLVEERPVLRALDQDPAGGSAVWGLDWSPVWATAAEGVSVEMIRTAKHRRKTDGEHRGCLRVTRLLLRSGPRQSTQQLMLLAAGGTSRAGFSVKNPAG